MYQSWVFLGTLAAGSGLFAYAVDNMTPSEAATHPPAVDAVHVVPPIPATVIHEPLLEPVVEIQPIVIEARKVVHRQVKATKAPAPVDRPCSEWRELGPSHVSKGKPSGTVSVRTLCP